MLLNPNLARRGSLSARLPFSIRGGRWGLRCAGTAVCGAAMKREREGNGEGNHQDGMETGECMRALTRTGRALKMARLMGNDPLKDVAIVEVDKPSPGPGEVLTRIKLRPVHSADMKVMNFGFSTIAKILLTPYAPCPNTDHSNVVGIEGYGIAEEVGDGVENIKPGQRVIPVILNSVVTAGTQGSWQDYVVTREEDVYPVPNSMDDATAAQFVRNPWAAYMMVKDLNAPKGEYIITTAGGSIVSRMVIQLAKHWGLKTIIIVRSDVYTEELEELGADVVINSNTEDVVATVLKLTNGKGAYGAIDAVGGTLTKSLAGSLRDNGQLFVHGFLGGSDVTISLLDLGRQVEVKIWGLPFACRTLERRKMVGNDLMRLFEEGTIAPLKSTRRFKFEDWKLAVAAADQKSTGGNKVLLAD